MCRPGGRTILDGTPPAAARPEVPVAAAPVVGQGTIVTIPAMPGALDLPNWADVVLRIAGIALVALVAILAIRVGARVAVDHLLDRRGREEAAGVLPPSELERRVRTIQRLAVRVAAIVIVVIAVLMMLSVFRIDIGPAIAGLGVVGIAVGLGAQTLVRDWLAGIFVVLENQYSQGDLVRIAGVDGVVEDFSLRRTTLRDLDGTIHSVPNGQIIVASNMTRSATRVTLDITIADAANADAAEALARRVVEQLNADPEWSLRMLEPPRTQRMASADEGVTLRIVGEARTAERGALAEELRERILAALAEAGIGAAASPAPAPAGA
jgi:small-conductance mechanosensitive channel